MIKSRYLKWVLFLSICSFILPFFQNCSNSNKTTGFKGTTSDDNLSNSDKSGSNSASSLGSQAANTAGLDKQTLKINFTASPEAQLDCSAVGAKLTTEIVNAGVDILVCLQDILDMPAGSARFQEKSLCDSAKKFGPVPITWKYELGNRRWLIPTEVLKNHTFLVPGAYSLFVKDNQGKIYQSSTATLKKSGFLNCHDGAGSSVGSSGQCSWSALAIGGSTLNPPKAACTEANAWSKAIDGNGIEQSCVCSNIPHPADPPVVRGYMAAAVYGHRNMEYYEFLTGNGSQQPSAINSTECIVGTTYRGYTSCPGDWLGESPNNYKSCEAWTQECTVNPN